MRFGGLNVLHDEDGNTYPVDDAGQLYVPLEFVQATGEGEIEVEKQIKQKTKKDICQCGFFRCHM